MECPQVVIALRFRQALACTVVLVLAAIGCGCAMRTESTDDADGSKPEEAVIQSLYEEAAPSLSSCYESGTTEDWGRCRPGIPLLFWVMDTYSEEEGLFEQMSEDAPLALVPVLDNGQIVGEFWIESVDGQWELSTVGGGQAADLLAAKELLLRRFGDENGEVRFVGGPLGEWAAARWDGHMAGVFPYARAAQLTFGVIDETEIPDPGSVYVDEDLERVLKLMR